MKSAPGISLKQVQYLRQVILPWKYVQLVYNIEEPGCLYLTVPEYIFTLRICFDRICKHNGSYYGIPQIICLIYEYCSQYLRFRSSFTVKTLLHMPVFRLTYFVLQ